MSKLQGIFAAVPTPFTGDGEDLDLPFIAKEVDRLYEGGIQGIVTTGTTGEFPTLSTEEHKSVIKAYVEAATGKFKVVAGIGSNSTKHAIEMVQYAQEVGADAVMVVPPFYDPLPFDALFKYYEDVCGSIKIPLMYYHLPGATGVPLTAEQIRKLATIEGFDYMKDTSGNAVEHTDLLTHQSTTFTLFNGYDTLTFSSLAHGSRGSIWGVASIVPKECSEFFNTLVVEKDIEKAREQWKFLWEISSFLEANCYPAGIKTAHDILGYSAGPLRLPTLPLSEEATKALTKILEKRKFK